MDSSLVLSLKGMRSFKGRRPPSDAPPPASPPPDNSTSRSQASTPSDNEQTEASSSSPTAPALVALSERLASTSLDFDGPYREQGIRGLVEFFNNRKGWSPRELHESVKSVARESRRQEEVEAHEADPEKNWEVLLGLERRDGFDSMLEKFMEGAPSLEEVPLRPYEVKTFWQHPTSALTMIEVMLAIMGCEEGGRAFLHAPCVGAEFLSIFATRAKPLFQKGLKVVLEMSITEAKNAGVESYLGVVDNVAHWDGDGGLKVYFQSESDENASLHAKEELIVFPSGLAFYIIHTNNFTSSGTGCRVFFASSVEQAQSVGRSRESMAIFRFDLCELKGEGAQLLKQWKGQMSILRNEGMFHWVTPGLIEAYSGKFDVEQQLDQEDDEDTRVKAYTDRYRRQLESGGKNTGPSTTQPNLMTRQRAALLATATNPSTSSFESSSGSISIASASEKAECEDAYQQPKTKKALLSRKQMATARKRVQDELDLTAKDASALRKSGSYAMPSAKVSQPTVKPKRQRIAPKPVELGTGIIMQPHPTGGSCGGCERTESQRWRPNGDGVRLCNHCYPRYWPHNVMPKGTQDDDSISHQDIIAFLTSRKLASGGITRRATAVKRLKKSDYGFGSVRR